MISVHVKTPLTCTLCSLAYGSFSWIKDCFDLSDKKKVDGLSKLFGILQDLHDAHAAVEEEERSKNKNVFLELQT